MRDSLSPALKPNLGHGAQLLMKDAMSRIAFALIFLLSGIQQVHANPELDRTARTLAGLIEDENYLGADRAGSLRGYSEKLSELWGIFDEQIRRPMRAWTETELRHTPGETIFYPFSGPDFPTAHSLYPDAGRYVLVALQKAGRIPQLDAFSPGALNEYLRSLRGGFESFTLRGFYNTDDLNARTRGEGPLEGITPALLAFSARLGFTIKAAYPLRINDDGSDVEVHPGDQSLAETWNSIRLVLDQDGQEIILDYLYLNLGNSILDQSTRARTWVQTISRNRVITKAASHLMQKAFFTTVRDAILSGARSIWQDETGLDYADLNREFHVRLYGHFTTANKLFAEGIQHSLARAYQNRTDIRPLPFKVGYKKQSGSCVQVGKRRGWRGLMIQLEELATPPTIY